MKTFAISLLAVCLVSFACHAADPDTTAPLTITGVNTGTYTQAVDSVTNTVAINGWLDTVIFNLSGATSPTVTVSIAAIDGGPYERTLFTVTNLASTNASYAVRDVQVNTSGTTISYQGARMPLLANKLVFKAYSANKTNINAKCYFIFSHE